MGNNLDRLRQILGPNPTRLCPPQQQLQTARLSRTANQQRSRQTVQRYGNFLQFVESLLRDVSRLSPQQIQHALDALVQWLGNDDPLDFLHSLQQGQLFNLLGEIAPVIAQWLGEAIGANQPGGRQSRRGGRVNVENQSVSGGLSALLGLGSEVYPFVRAYFADSASSPSSSGFASFSNPEGSPDTIEVPAGGSDGGGSGNTLVIPSMFGGDDDES